MNDSQVVQNAWGHPVFCVEKYTRIVVHQYRNKVGHNPIHCSPHLTITE